MLYTTKGGEGFVCVSRGTSIDHIRIMCYISGMIDSPSDKWFNSWGGVWFETANNECICSWYPFRPYVPERCGIGIVGKGTDMKSARSELYFTMREYMWDRIRWGLK